MRGGCAGVVPPLHAGPIAGPGLEKGGVLGGDDPARRDGCGGTGAAQEHDDAGIVKRIDRGPHQVGEPIQRLADLLGGGLQAASRVDAAQHVGDLAPPLHVLLQELEPG